MAYPEPSINDHLAPWNEGEDGECECSSCRAAAKRAAREERDIDRWEDERMERGKW